MAKQNNGSTNTNDSEKGKQGRQKADPEIVQAGIDFMIASFGLDMGKGQVLRTQAVIDKLGQDTGAVSVVSVDTGTFQPTQVLPPKAGNSLLDGIAFAIAVARYMTRSPDGRLLVTPERLAALVACEERCAALDAESK